MIFVDKENIHEKLKLSDKLVFLLFWSYDCMACDLLNPYLLKLSKAYKNDINFYKIDVQKNYEIATVYNIDTIPSILIFDKLTIVEKIEKVKKKEVIEKKIRDILKNYI